MIDSWTLNSGTTRSDKARSSANTISWLISVRDAIEGLWPRFKTNKGAAERRPKIKAYCLDCLSASEVKPDVFRIKIIYLNNVSDGFSSLTSRTRSYVTRSSDEPRSKEIEQRTHHRSYCFYYNTRMHQSGTCTIEDPSVQHSSTSSLMQPLYHYYHSFFTVRGF